MRAFDATLDAMLAFIDPEGLLKRLTSEIDLMPIPKLALTPADRAKRLAEFKIKIFKLDRLEVEHIYAAAGEGLPRGRPIPTLILAGGSARQIAIVGVVTGNDLLAGFLEISVGRR